ncbi:MAG: hypothetical protein KC457_00485 [Myxococcales bacterium]|nr:hypothetical protein [Myxococcales bacterium]
MRMAVAYAVARKALPQTLQDCGLPGTKEIVVATLVVAEGSGPAALAPGLTRVVAELRPEQRPLFVRLRQGIERIELTDGLRPLKSPLRSAGVDLDDPHTLRWDGERGEYRL